MTTMPRNDASAVGGRRENKNHLTAPEPHRAGSAQPPVRFRLHKFRGMKSSKCGNTLMRPIRYETAGYRIRHVPLCMALANTTGNDAVQTAHLLQQTPHHKILHMTQHCQSTQALACGTQLHLRQGFPFAGPRDSPQSVFPS